MEIKVFQIDSDLDTKRMGFRKLASADPSGEKNIDSDIYKPVYETEIESAVDMDPFKILEDLFRQTNIGERPDGYTGHSLSVSDVVQLGPDFYFCDSFGFEKLNAFCPGGKPQEEKFQVECEAMIRRMVDHIRVMDGDDLATLVADMFVVDVSCDYDDKRGQLVFDISPRPDAGEDFKKHTYGSAKEVFKDAIISKPSGPKMG
jgi:hypothetical protein